MSYQLGLQTHRCWATALLMLALVTTLDEARADRIGPSFSCPTPRDPLAQLICSSVDLSRLDIQFVQAYQALRQQVGESGQRDLRREAEEFGLSVRINCGVAMAQSASFHGPLPPQAPPDAVPCVLRAYNQQKLTWQQRLLGSAVEEGRRSFEDQVKLQAALYRRGFFAETTTIDGIYGSATRIAILAWQNANGRTRTGLLGNEDALILLKSVQEEPEGQNANVEFSRKLNDTAARPATAQEIRKGMTKEQVIEAIGNPVATDKVPPDTELWRYSTQRIVFTADRVTYIGH